MKQTEKLASAMYLVKSAGMQEAVPKDLKAKIDQIVSTAGGTSVGSALGLLLGAALGGPFGKAFLQKAQREQMFREIRAIGNVVRKDLGNRGVSNMIFEELNNPQYAAMIADQIKKRSIDSGRSYLGVLGAFTGAPLGGFAGYKYSEKNKEKK